MAPALLLLAGTSEAGKSTAGAYLADRGARRVKIRTILTGLTSGRPVHHEGVAMREDFAYPEFLEQVNRLAHPGDQHVVVIESFIDADLAEATRRSWPGQCRIVFITAARATRVRRLAAARNISEQEAGAIIDVKDVRKRVAEQLSRWRAIADDWIDNDGPQSAYLARLDLVLTAIGADPTYPPEGRA